MSARMTVAMLAASCMLCVVTQVRAQDAARQVRGRVVEARNEKPIPGVSVYLDREPGDNASGGDGTFKLSVDRGGHRLLLRRAGYVPVHADVPPGDTVDVGTIHLRQVKNDADRDTVEAADVELYPRLASFYQRKHTYRQGSFFTPDDLAHNAGSLTQIIRARQGFRNMCVANRREELDCGQMSERGPSTIYGSGRRGNEEQQMCFVRVWTDDLTPERSLEEIRLDELLAVEAYSNPHTTPREFPGSTCVTIRLWMKNAGR